VHKTLDNLNLSIFKNLFWPAFRREINLLQSVFLVPSQIFRHGDRNPTNAYKTDLYANADSYVGGWGALTLVKQILFVYLHILYNFKTYCTISLWIPF